MNRSKTIWQSFRSTVDGIDSSGQLAAGVVFGCLVGLIPKESVLWILLIVAAIMTNANLLTTGVSAIFFGFAGMAAPFQNLAHRVGVAAFESSSLKPLLSQLFEIPALAWTRLENSLVFGSLMLGLVLVIPLYLISKRLFERYRQAFIQALQQKKFFRWLAGSEKLDAARGQ